MKRDGYGIWEFSESIAQYLLMRPDFNYGYDPETETRQKDKIDYVGYLKENIKRFDNLKRRIINTINDDLVSSGFWGRKQPDNFAKIRYIIKLFNLAPFFKELNRNNKLHKRMLTRLSSLKKLGRPIEMRHQLASIWAQVIKDKRGTNWLIIELLLRWFFINFQGSVYCKEFGVDMEDFNQFNLKNEYYRLKRKYMRYIEGFRNTFFPIPREAFFYKIEFNIDYVRINGEMKDPVLISFPNGVTFP